MKLVIDIPKKTYNEIKERTIVTHGEIFAKNLVRRIRNGTPLQISADGTLSITVDDATKIDRVLVQDNKHNGGLFYADSN